MYLFTESMNLGMSVTDHQDKDGFFDSLLYRKKVITQTRHRNAFLRVDLMAIWILIFENLKQTLDMNQMTFSRDLSKTV